MPQTTGAMNTIDAVLEVSTNGTSWTNISGSANKVEVVELTADTGAAASLEGQYKIVRVGKSNPAEVKATIFYTEVANEAFAILWAQYNTAGKPLYMRWAPAGNNGEWRWFTADANDNKTPGRISRLQLPGADAETAAPTLLSFSLMVTKVGREAQQPSPSASTSPSASASA